MTDRRNVWTCERCSRSIHARDLDEGVTPFMLECYATPRCDGQMQSRFYREQDSWDAIMITHEWWKPSDDELEIYCDGLRVELPAQGAPKDAVETVVRSVKEHVVKGGLLLREVPGWKRQLDDTLESGLPAPTRAPRNINSREKLVRS